MAQRYWQGANDSPLGDFITIGDRMGANFADTPRHIVGIVADVRDAGVEHEPSMYIAIYQVPDRLNARNDHLRPIGSGDVQSRIVLRTLSLAGFGLVLGLTISRALSTGLGSLLFGVTAGDPVTFVGIALVLTTVSALAGYIPAWRASRIDPMIALRSN
jgi:hypothetical protein